MKCPACGHEFKDPAKIAGGKASKRKLTKKAAREMAAKSHAKRRENAKKNEPKETK
jgi:hypothetical protein